MENRLTLQKWMDVQNLVLERTIAEFPEALGITAEITNNMNLATLWPVLETAIKSNPGKDFVITLTNTGRR